MGRTMITLGCILLIARFAIIHPALAAANDHAVAAKAGADGPVVPPAAPSEVRLRAGSLVASLSHGQQHVVRVFAGPDALVGAVIENAAKVRDIAWLTPHARALLAGPLVGIHGEDLTREAKIDQGLILSPATALAKARASGSLGSFLVGSDGPVLTVFFDPNCVYCHQLYGALAPMIATGRVRVRFVIVGTLKPTSIPRAAAILASTDPAQALARNEQDYDAAHEEGGFPVAAHVDPRLTEAVSANNQLFGKAGMTGTPSMLVCHDEGDVRLVAGVPSDLTALVSGAGPCP